MRSQSNGVEKEGIPSLNEALYDACIFGQAREVRRLLSGGADANAVHRRRYTALMAASQKGHVEVVDMLLAAQANGTHHSVATLS